MMMSSTPENDTLETINLDNTHEEVASSTTASSRNGGRADSPYSTQSTTTAFDDEENLSNSVSDADDDSNYKEGITSCDELLDKYNILDLHSLSQHLSAVLNDPRDQPTLFETINDWWFADSDQTQQNKLQNDTIAAILPKDNIVPKAYPSSEFKDYIQSISPVYFALEDSRRRGVRDKPKEKINPLQVIVEDRGVPSTFFDDNFNLSSPTTFEEIFPTDAMAASLLLQEKLAHYLDEVEVLLLRQVTFRSSEIFHSLLQYSALNNELAAGIPYIQSLRDSIRDIFEIGVRRPLSVGQLTRRRANLLLLNTKIDAMMTIQQAQSAIQLLISQSDYVSAIDLIESSHVILRNELSGLGCFKHLSQQLKEETGAIEKRMEQEFITITIEQGIDEFVEQSDTLEFRSQLMPVIQGLVRMNHIQPALQNYRDELIKYCQDLLKTTLEKSLASIPSLSANNIPSPSVKSNSSNLSPKNIQQIAGLSHEQFIQVTRDIFTVLYSIILKTYYVYRVIDEFCADENMKFSNMRQSNLRSEMEKVFVNVCEICHTRCSTIFRLRNDEVKKMARKELLDYMSNAFDFIDKCEKLLDKKISTLRGTLQQQGQTYLDDFKAQKLQILNDSMDRENWAVVDKIPLEFQILLNQMTDFSASLKDDSDEDEENASAEPNRKEKATANGKHEHKYLLIHHRKFPTANTFLLLTKTLGEYMEMLTPAYHFINPLELSQGIYKLLVEFNIKAKSLVLNAKAVNEVTGLSSITAKHILLSAECLHTLIHLIPYLQQTLETKLDTIQKKSIKFGDLIKNLKIHRDELKNKLFGLMQDRVSEQAKQALKFNWDAATADQKTPLNSVLRDLIYLFRISDQFLGTHKEDQIEYLTGIIRMFFGKLKVLIEGARGKVKTRNGRDKMKQEVSQFRLCLLQASNRGKYSSDVDTGELDMLFDQTFSS